MAPEGRGIWLRDWSADVAARFARRPSPIVARRPMAMFRPLVTPILSRVMRPVARYGPAFAKTLVSRPPLVLRLIAAESAARPVLTVQSNSPPAAAEARAEVRPAPVQRAPAESQRSEAEAAEQPEQPAQEQSLLSRVAGMVLRVFRAEDSSRDAQPIAADEREGPVARAFGDESDAEVAEIEAEESELEFGEEEGEEAEEAPASLDAGPARPALSLRVEPARPRGEEAPSAPVSRQVEQTVANPPPPQGARAIARRADEPVAEEAPLPLARAPAAPPEQLEVTEAVREPLGASREPDIALSRATEEPPLSAPEAAPEAADSAQPAVVGKLEAAQEPAPVEETGALGRFMPALRRLVTRRAEPQAVAIEAGATEQASPMAAAREEPVAADRPAIARAAEASPAEPASPRQPEREPGTASVPLAQVEATPSPQAARGPLTFLRRVFEPRGEEPELRATESTPAEQAPTGQAPLAAAPEPVLRADEAPELPLGREPGTTGVYRAPVIETAGNEEAAPIAGPLSREPLSLSLPVMRSASREPASEEPGEVGETGRAEQRGFSPLIERSEQYETAPAGSGPLEHAEGVDGAVLRVVSRRPAPPPPELVYRVARSPAEGSREAPAFSRAAMLAVQRALYPEEEPLPVFASGEGATPVSSQPGMVGAAIQRQEEGGATAAGGAPAGGDQAAPGEAAGGPDLEKLAREVYIRIQRRLLVERERAGVSAAFT